MTLIQLNRRGWWWSVVLGLFATICVARGVQAAPEPLRTITIPGTPGAFGAALGLQTTAVERSRFMLELVRHVWGLNGGHLNVAVFDRLVLQVKALQRLQKAWFNARGRDNGIGLEDARSSGKARTFLALIGLKLEERGRDGRPEIVVDPSSEGLQARDAIAASGVDEAAVAAALNAGRRVNFTLSSFAVPLPLLPSVWTRRILRSPVDTEWLFAGILAHRQAALLYHGLLSLDPETLAFFASQPVLVERIASEHAPVFAVYGRSIHVRAGRVVVPGGDVPEVVELWEGATGRKVTDPLRFIDQLLRKGSGRLAYLYDVVEHLDPPHQRFALGTRAGEGRAAFERLAALVQEPDPELDVPGRPFRRPPVDLFVVLSSLGVTADGELRPPFDAVMWPELLAGGAESRALSAAGVARLVLFPDPGGRLGRLRLVLFSQRALEPSKPEQTSQVLEAFKHYRSYPLLYAVLERIGVRKASTYAAAALWAARLSAIRDPDIESDSISQFQAGLALVDRCVFTGRLAPAAASRLVERLLELPTDSDGSFADGITQWLAGQLLPALEPTAATDREEDGRRKERALLRALAGVRADGRSRPFVWKDAEYSYDVGEAEFARLERVRKKQGGNSLDSVLDLAARAGDLRSSARTMASGRQTITSILNLGAALQEPLVSGRRAPGVKATVTLVAARLQTLQQIGDVKRLDEVANTVERLVEFLLATTLRSIVYAVHIADPDGPALIEGDVSLLHDFGGWQPAAEARQAIPWLPAIGGGSPWHASNSLLALDVTLWDLSFRAISNEPPTGRLLMTEEDVRYLAQAVPVFNAYEVSDEDTRWIAQAVDRGRLRVEAAMTDGAALRALGVEAGLGEWALETLPWALEFDKEAARSAFTLVQLVRLGSREASASMKMPEGVADRWGTSAAALTGSLRLREQPDASWDSFSWRSGAGYLSLFAADMPLHVAEWLGRMKLPAALARVILPAAMQDLRDGARLAHWNDWRALARYAVEYQDQRFSDLLSTLADSGALALAGRQ
jgi:hypothetical protein